MLRCVQRWRTSVKATHLVVAIHDYFARLRYAETQIATKSHRRADDSETDRRNVHAPGPVPEGADLGEVEVYDQWALPFIRVHHVAKLAEVIDDDMSSFVNVEELNAFTAARPAQWRYEISLLPRLVT